MVTLTGTAGNDSLAGGNNADTLDGKAGNDSLFGGNANDRLIGGDGSDSLFGGAGTDTVGGGNGQDSAFGGDGNDVMWGGADTARDTHFGDAGNDTMSGDGGDDRLSGGAGVDTMYGGAGNDSLDGGDGNDVAVFTGARAAYTYLTVSGVTTVSRVGVEDVDRLSNVEFLQFDDTIVPLGSSPPPPPPPPPNGAYVSGTAGNDSLAGEAGNDTIRGLDGNDQLAGNNGNDSVFGSLGNDTVFGGEGQDTLSGDSNIDTLYGGGGNDTLLGAQHVDLLVGGDGNDSLDGGQGNDSIDGGNGIDTAIYGGNSADFTWSFSGGAGTVSNGIQSDSLRNVEFLQFLDRVVPVADVPDQPPSTPTDSNSATNTVAENAANGTSVGITASSTDPDPGSTIVYSLIDNAGGRFVINGSSGVVTVADGTLLDFEDDTSHTITVRATSGGLSRDQTFTISVTNVDEPITSVTDTNAAPNQVIAGAGTGSLVGITAFGVDPDAGSTVLYEMADSAGSRFRVDSETGVVSVLSGGGSLLAGASHTITVRAISDGSIKEQDFVINVVSGGSNLPPTAITDSNDTANSVAENASNGTAVGITASSTDPENGTITYSLSDSAGGRFAINSSSGIVTVANAALLNYEANASHSITVRASDGTNTVSQIFTIDVANVNEAPAAPSDNNSAPNGFALSAAQVGMAVGVTALSSDPEGSTVSYALSTNPSSLFAIDSSSGIVTLASTSGLAAGTYQIGVTASDGSLTGPESTFSITVTGDSGGTEFRVNNAIKGDQDTSNEYDTGANMVAGLTGGGFVVVMHSGGWADGPAGENHNEGVWARQYDASGAATGGWFQVNTIAPNEQIEPAVAALTTGGYVISYTSWEDSPASYDVRARVYNASGTPGAEFQINNVAGQNQYHSAVVGLGGGNFVVTWTSETTGAGDVDNSGSGISARLFNSSGTAITNGTTSNANQFSVNGQTTNDQFDSSIAKTSDGFVITWTTDSGSAVDSTDIHAQRFSATGAKLGSEIVVNGTVDEEQQYSSVCGLTGPNGGFVVTWSSFVGTSFDIYAQRFNANGTKADGEFRVNSTLASTQTDSSVLALSDGGFLVSWTSATGDGSGNGVFAQRYGANGSKIGGEFRVNVTTASSQNDPHLAQFSGDDVVAVWTGRDSDSSEGVYGRIYDNFS